MNHVGKELVIARVLSGKSAMRVAQEARVHRSDLSRIERGRLIPSPEELERLRRAAGWVPQIGFFVAMMLGTRTTTAGSPTEEINPFSVA